MVDIITKEELEAMKDPIAKSVWEIWIRQGKAVLVNSKKETEHDHHQ